MKFGIVRYLEVAYRTHTENSKLYFAEYVQYLTEISIATIKWSTSVEEVLVRANSRSIYII